MDYSDEKNILSEFIFLENDFPKKNYVQRKNNS